MIEFDKDSITKEELIEITKKYPGIRQKTNKDGSFEIYATGGTVIIDTFRNFFTSIIKKLNVKRT